MEHAKAYHSMNISTSLEDIVIEGPLSSEQLSHYNFHEHLTAFRPANKQFQALKEIAELEEGRIIVARTKDTIVGYVTYLYPDPLERWSVFKLERLLELGAIEVIPAYRGAKVGSNLLKLSMFDPAMENYIIISTEYYWHWDLTGTQLSIWEYRNVMERMMGAGGLVPAPTDDPEIVSHPANCLMVRIGSNVDQETIDKFNELRFLRRSRYSQPKE